MKNIDFTITNDNVMKSMYGDPFDEFYSVVLALTFKSEKESITLSLFSTGGWEDKPSCEWKRFHITLLSADVYHEGTVSLEVTADAYEMQGSVDPVFQETLRAAKEGDLEAMFALSEIYRKGDAGIEKDESKSLTWCRKAAEAGSAKAMCALGDKLIGGRGVKWEVNEGYWWYSRAAKADPEIILQEAKERNPVAMYKLGELLMGEEQIEQAVDWFQKAGERGIVRAMDRLGEIFRNGPGPIKKDMAQSVSWYERAVEGGNSYAMVTLADLYFKGKEIQKDVEKALEWLERAAEAGGTLAEEAMTKLGHLYAYGKDFPKDTQEAVRWFHKAGEAGSRWAMAISENLEKAENGDPEAMYNLGQKYHGRRDGYELALHWFEQAAEKGHSGAMHQLGVMHYQGQGVDQDAVQACVWFESAARQGNRQAMHALGDIYVNGLGVARDVRKATELFQKAAAGASEEALEKVKFFSYVENIIKKWIGFSSVTESQGPESALLKAKYVVDAEKGDSDAMYIMGCIYRFWKDYPVARAWYRRAADQGHTEAMCTIGNDYYSGYGESRDYGKALKWFRRAAKLGYRKAVERLEEIQKKGG